MAQKILDPNCWSLQDVFKSIYNVPVYQRPYSWDKEQVEVLMNDLWDAFTSEEKNDGYFTGNIIIYDKKDKIAGLITKYDIIDGQQRLTTFSLLLMVLYSKIMSFKEYKDDKTLIDVRSALWKSVERQIRKDLRTVELNSIEKECFAKLYDCCFDSPTKIHKHCKEYKCSSAFDERIIKNSMDIWNFLDGKISKEKKVRYLDFAEYILNYVQFIAIGAECPKTKVFSMFESINSKGKKLEDIDLIKTYIFSKLDEDSYSTYLNKWGELIKRTQDHLYDYLYNYIKAYICFYRQNISVVNFKKICREELLAYADTKDVGSALKKLLDDMYERVEFYNMLNSTDSAYKIIRDARFRFFYNLFVELNYQHPKALLLRILIDVNEGKLNKKDAVDVAVETIKYVMKFLSIDNRDSKDAISFFQNVMKDIYEHNGVQRNVIIDIIKAELLKQGMLPEKLKADIGSYDAYSQNRLTVSLLALYESTEFDEKKGKAKISYDQAYYIVNTFSKTFSLDHLLVQTPKKDSKYMYYKDEKTNLLVLKENSDFPTDRVTDGMDYEMFKRLILNNIGNLRVYYRDKNSSRGNKMIMLPEYSDFCTYAQIKERCNRIADILIDYSLAPIEK
ncbi:MAG: DUF262 domain-containing protein [Fibrobacter sp.]|nr:DUF262 domain-containing protein [Fibrobacter sp.]